MGGGTTTNQTQQQQSQTSPWAPAQPMLSDLLSRLQGTNTNITGAQTGALNNIEANAANAPNFGGSAADLAKSLFAGGGPDRTGIAGDAYSTLQRQLNPTANGANIGPNGNPQLKGYLDSITNDVSNNVNSTFAAAGRDLSGYNTQTLARGIAQGQAPVLAAQYNTDRANQMDAAKTLYGAGTGTAQTLSGMDQTRLANQTAGLGVASAIPGLTNQNNMSVLAAEAQRTGIPLSLLQQITGMTGGIASLGNQSSGQTVGQATQNTDPTRAIIGAGVSMLPLLLSDERVKDDIHQVGTLYDGQKLYSYRYKGDPTPRVGLIAQEVERRDPGAVHDVGGGVKAVDYGRATEPARRLGMLDELLRAA